MAGEAGWGPYSTWAASSTCLEATSATRFVSFPSCAAPASILADACARIATIRLDCNYIIVLCDSSGLRTSQTAGTKAQPRACRWAAPGRWAATGKRQLPMVDVDHASTCRTEGGGKGAQQPGHLRSGGLGVVLDVTGHVVPDAGQIACQHLALLPDCACHFLHILWHQKRNRTIFAGPQPWADT